MLNYIRAELYKVFRRRYFYVLLGLLLAGVGLLCASWMYGWRGVEFTQMVQLMGTTMVFGLFLVIPLTNLVLSDTQGQGVLKNEISFGIPRARIYLGKLLSALLLALLVCGMLYGTYLGLSFLLGAHSDRAAERAALGELGHLTAAALPLWLGMLSLSVMLYVLLRSSTMAALTLLLGLVFGPYVLDMFASITLRPFQALAWAGRWISLIHPFWYRAEELGVGPMAYYWLQGVGWTAATTGIGLAVLRKKEL